MKNRLAQINADHVYFHGMPPSAHSTTSRDPRRTIPLCGLFLRGERIHIPKKTYRDMWPMRYCDITLAIAPQKKSLTIAKWFVWCHFWCPSQLLQCFDCPCRSTFHKP